MGAYAGPPALTLSLRLFTCPLPPRTPPRWRYFVGQVRDQTMELLRDLAMRFGGPLGGLTVAELAWGLGVVQSRKFVVEGQVGWTGWTGGKGALCCPCGRAVLC